MADGLVEVDLPQLELLSKALGAAKTAFDDLLKSTTPTIKVTAGTFNSALGLQGQVNTRKIEVEALLTNLSNGIGALQAQLNIAIERYRGSINDLGLITDLQATIDSAIGGHLPGLTDK